MIPDEKTLEQVTAETRWMLWQVRAAARLLDIVPAANLVEWRTAFDLCDRVSRSQGHPHSIVTAAAALHTLLRVEELGAGLPDELLECLDPEQGDDAAGGDLPRDTGRTRRNWRLPPTGREPLLHDQQQQEPPVLLPPTEVDDLRDLAARYRATAAKLGGDGGADPASERARLVERKLYLAAIYDVGAILCERLDTLIDAKR